MRRGLALGGIVIALAIGASGTASAAAPPGPRLAVVKWDFFSERQVLETVNHRGAQPLRLAGGGERKRPLPELFEAPSWSPDGSQIAFAGVARRLEGGPKNNRLYVVGADGTGLRPVRGTRGALQPVFTTDGSAVAFSRFWRRGTSIWLAPLTGGAPRRLTARRRGLDMFPGSFSPDGSTLIASRSVPSQASEDIVAVNIGTGQVDQILRHGTEPVYSSDGTKLAFVRWLPTRYSDGTKTAEKDVFTASSDGTRVRRLTQTRLRDEHFPSWDPSGERLAFVRNLREPIPNDFIELGLGAAVIQVNADGSCPRPILKPSIDGTYGSAWQPGPGRAAGRIPCRAPNTPADGG